MVINKLANDYATYGIAVNSGGTMAVTGSTFTRNGTVGNENAAIQVAAGGHLTASGSTFSLDNVSLAAGSVLNSGDMTGNVFNTTLTAPVTDVPLLTNNLSFNAVYVTGGLASGQSVTLAPLGTQTTANQYYALPSGLTVASGATLTIATGASFYIGDAQTLSVSGQLNVIDASVLINKLANDYATYGIAVNSGGTMTATGSTFTRNGSVSNETAIIQVGNGGHLTASNSTFSLDNLYLNSGSSDQLTVNVLATQLQVNSGASISVTDNDFTNGTVVASGDSTGHDQPHQQLLGHDHHLADRRQDHGPQGQLQSPDGELYAVPIRSHSDGRVSATVAANTSSTFNTSSQTVTLSATVTSGAVNVNEGNETFTILNGINIVGTPVTVTVANGAASTGTSYSLPAGYRRRDLHDPSHLLRHGELSRLHRRQPHSDRQHGGHQHRRQECLDDLQHRRSIGPPQRDHFQLGRHRQRGHGDLHDPQRRDDDRHGHLGHDRERRRHRHRHAARRHRRQQVHDPGRLQRLGELRRLLGFQSSPDGQLDGHDHRRHLLGRPLGRRPVRDLHGRRDRDLAGPRDARRQRHVQGRDDHPRSPRRSPAGRRPSRPPAWRSATTRSRPSTPAAPPSPPAPRRP